MRYFYFIVFAFFSSNVLSDPEWYKANLTEQDCTNLPNDYDRSSCLGEYYQQRSEVFDAYIIDTIRHSLSGDAGGCRADELEVLWKNLVASWSQYQINQCTLETYCHGGAIECGMGQSSAMAPCLEKVGERKLAFYEDRIKSGIDIWGCTFIIAPNRLNISTENYDVTINFRCDMGFIDCNNIEYVGVNRKTGAAISLEGGKFSYFDKKNEIRIPDEFTFLNGEIEYVVTLKANYGFLKVIDKRNEKVILEEMGMIK